MERDVLTQGFRARATQLLSWLTGMREQGRQQQTMQADRQVADGVTRAMEDPDNRRQQQPSRQTPQGATRADMEAFRDRMQTNPAYQQEMDSGYRPRPTPTQDQTQQWMSGRSRGYDGDDDVRRPREVGPPSGSEAAALAQVRFEANIAREAQRDAREESLTAQLSSLQQRLEAQQRAQQQHSRSRGQGMGW